MEKNYGIKSDFSYIDNTIFFSTVNKINRGINLEELQQKDYYIFLRIAYSNSDIKYYSLFNKSQYVDTTYYTITKNNSNNKIIISFNSYNEIKYMNLNISEANSLPDDIYDIAIDIGISKTKKDEEELLLNCGKNLKNMLENKGLKVYLARENIETIDNENNMYDENGRINRINSIHSKYLLSLDLSNNTYSKKNGGVEVYAAPNCDLSLAKNIAQNIVQKANTSYSKYNSFKKEDRCIC